MRTYDCSTREPKLKLSARAQGAFRAMKRGRLRVTHQAAGLMTGMAGECRRSAWNVCAKAKPFCTAATCCRPRGAPRHPQQAAASAKRQQAAAVQGATARHQIAFSRSLHYLSKRLILAGEMALSPAF